MTAEDAIEFFMVGASAIEIGTGNFIDPAISVKVAQGISDWLDRHVNGIENNSPITRVDAL